MSSISEFDAALARCPLIAILRGVKPDEAKALVAYLRAHQ